MRIVSIVTLAARGFLGVVALAGIVGLIAGGVPIFGEAARAIAHPPHLAAIAAALAVGALLAWRGHPPARLLAQVPARGFAAAIVAVALVTALWAHWRIHKHVPQVPDELGYLHTARTFAGGDLVAPSPPAPEFHYVSWGTHDGGRWYAVFPPGYPLLLAGGERVGAPWLINPLLGAALALILWALAREVLGGDGAGARLAPLLFLGSWFRLMNEGSYMAHPTAALAGALAVLGIWRGVLGEGRRARVWAGVGGAALAFLGATRQLDAVIVAAALVPVVAWALVRRRRQVVGPLLLAALCALPIASGYLAYNHALTGSALLPPQQRYMQLKERRGDCFRLGFGPGVGECPLTQNTSFGKDGFQPRHAVANTRKRLDAWTRYSFGWAPLALLPVLGLLGGAIAGGAAARRRALLAGVVVATVLGYGLFFYHGVAYGARFYYLGFPFALLASAAAVVDLGGWLARRGRGGVIASGALGLALPAVVVAGMIAQRPAIEQHAGKRPHLQDGKVVRVLDAPSLHGTLVFVDSMVIPAAFNAHPAAVGRNQPLVVKDLGDRANAGFARIYPEREPYRLRGLRLQRLTYPPDAPMRHEGGALYPLEQARGGFGDRAPVPWVGNLPLSSGAALRFTLDHAGPARFGFPVWAIAADAGPITLGLGLAHHPRGPTFDLLVDGVPVARGLATAAPTWTLVEHPVDLELGPGRHWVELAIPSGRPADVLFIDYAELRRRPTPTPTPPSPKR